MPIEGLDLFGNHYKEDNCNIRADLGKPLDWLKTLGWFALNRETAKNFRRYGLWGIKIHGIAQEGLRNIQEFIKQGGTQVEYPLAFTPPTNFDANNYPLGTYLRTYTDIHFLFSPKTPGWVSQFVKESPLSTIYRSQIRGRDYIQAQAISIGVVTPSPNPKERFAIHSYGSDLQILQGRNGYNSIVKPVMIGEWSHLPIKGPNIGDSGVRIDIFATFSKIEILQAGETEKVSVAVGKRVFAPN